MVGLGDDAHSTVPKATFKNTLQYTCILWVLISARITSSRLIGLQVTGQPLGNRVFINCVHSRNISRSAIQLVDLMLQLSFSFYLRFIVLSLDYIYNTDNIYKVLIAHKSWHPSLQRHFFLLFAVHRTYCILRDPLAPAFRFSSKPFANHLRKCRLYVAAQSQVEPRVDCAACVGTPEDCILNV